MSGKISILAAVAARQSSAPVAKLVDARDLKSLDLTVVPVRPRPGAPTLSRVLLESRNRTVQPRFNQKKSSSYKPKKSYTTNDTKKTPGESGRFAVMRQSLVSNISKSRYPCFLSALRCRMASLREVHQCHCAGAT